MTFITSLISKFYGYAIGLLGLVIAFFSFKESVRRGERERIAREAAIEDAKIREEALKERIKNEKHFNQFSVDDKRDKLRKYSRPDNK